MQTPAEKAGACFEINPTVFGETARILPKASTEYNNRQNWLRLVRALRGERDQQLLELHRQRLSEHLGNVVLFPKDASTCRNNQIDTRKTAPESTLLALSGAIRHRN